MRKYLIVSFILMASSTLAAPNSCWKSFIEPGKWTDQDARSFIQLTQRKIELSDQVTYSNQRKNSLAEKEKNLRKLLRTEVANLNKQIELLLEKLSLEGAYDFFQNPEYSQMKSFTIKDIVYSLMSKTRFSSAESELRQKFILFKKIQLATGVKSNFLLRELAHSALNQKLSESHIIHILKLFFQEFPDTNASDLLASWQHFGEFFINAKYGLLHYLFEEGQRAFREGRAKNIEPVLSSFAEAYLNLNQMSSPEALFLEKAYAQFRIWSTEPGEIFTQIIELRTDFLREIMSNSTFLEMDTQNLSQNLTFLMSKPEKGWIDNYYGQTKANNLLQRFRLETTIDFFVAVVNRFHAGEISGKNLAVFKEFFLLVMASRNFRKEFTRAEYSALYDFQTYLERYHFILKFFQ